MPGQQVSRLSCAKHLDTAQASEAALIATDKPLHIRDKCARSMHSVDAQAAYHTQAEHEWQCDMCIVKR
ncbi:hypothetical protein GQ54DRAFT_300778 [Martensiomyces pterosporus]|nr:hypothetical protein GQ54DRAFT_300778 [Martensiomyces pterosporus]